MASLKKKYKGTLWRYSPEAVSSGRPSDVLFAVVSTLDASAGVLLAWEMEMRSYGLYHPMYGHIPYEYVDKFDLFTEGDSKTFPKFEFRADSYEMIMIDDNVDISKLQTRKKNK